jgi:hypothetical protein
MLRSHLSLAFSRALSTNVKGAHESIPPAYVAWRAGRTEKIVVQTCQADNRFWAPLKGLQMRALLTFYTCLPFFAGVCQMYILCNTPIVFSFCAVSS